MWSAFSLNQYFFDYNLKTIKTPQFYSFSTDIWDC